MSEAVTYPRPDLKAGLPNAALLGENILVRRWPPDDKSAGGIELPKDARQDRMAAWIEKLPATEACKGMQIGDTVLFPAYAMINLPELGDDIFLVAAKDITLHYPKETTNAQ
jgi:co-chaperonin GroES (HSP10)